MNYVDEEDILWSRYGRTDEPGSLFDAYDTPEDDDRPEMRRPRPTAAARRERRSQR